MLLIWGCCIEWQSMSVAAVAVSVHCCGKEGECKGLGDGLDNGEEGDGREDDEVESPEAGDLETIPRILLTFLAI